MKGRHYRIVNPVRFFIFICICVFTIVFSAYTLININSAQASSVNTYQQVVVHDNGTLWDIAEDYCKSNMDIRDYIDDICDVNDISSNDVLYEGEIIFVPIYD